MRDFGFVYIVKTFFFHVQLYCIDMDTYNINLIHNYTYLVWSGPLQIIIALILRGDKMGASIWAGVAVMILTIPLNTFIAQKMRNLQKIQMGNKDSRIRLMVKETQKLTML